MPYVEAAGAKLYFEESGHGYPIIFIHEFASDIRGWESQLRHFSRGYRCIAYNARGYPPSDVPEDASLYRWQFAVDDIAAVMWDLKIERAHLVGMSMGGYAALQFGLRYPEKTSALVAASVGSGSHPSHRDAWLRETSVLARIFIEHGMVSMSERMARGPARIQLKYKDQKSWREFIVRLRQHSALGMSNTMARCQALRPSLHDIHHQFSEMTIPVLLAVGAPTLHAEASTRHHRTSLRQKPADQSGIDPGLEDGPAIFLRDISGRQELSIEAQQEIRR